MRTLKSTLMGLVATFLYLFAAPNLQAQSISTDSPCTVSNGIARISPKGMSDVREVTVLRPDGGVVYIYSPQLGVYNLVSPRAGTIAIDPLSQVGSQRAEDGKLHQRTIFSDAGSYRLIVLGKMAKATSNMQYTRIGCSLDFAENQGFQRVTVLNAIAKDPISSSLACPKGEQPALMAACRPSGGCQSGGDGYCCSQGGPGTPCWCNNCCVALAPKANEFRKTP